MNINQEIADLRVRVAALEAGTTCPHIVSSDEGTSYCDLALQTATSQPDPIDEEENDLRFRAALAAIENATPEQIRSAAGLPERSSLVERVAIACAKPCNETWDDQAVAAICEVAAALKDVGFIAAAHWLKLKADRDIAAELEATNG
jgi:hypothetical protein